MGEEVGADRNVKWTNGGTRVYARTGTFRRISAPPRLESSDQNHPTIYHQGDWDKGDEVNPQAGKRPHDEGIVTSAGTTSFSLLSFAPRRQVSGQPNLVEPNTNPRQAGKHAKAGKVLVKPPQVTMSSIKSDNASYHTPGRHAYGDITDSCGVRRGCPIAIRQFFLKVVVVSDFIYSVINNQTYDKFLANSCDTTIPHISLILTS